MTFGRLFAVWKAFPTRPWPIASTMSDWRTTPRRREAIVPAASVRLDRVRLGVEVLIGSIVPARRPAR